MTVSLSYVNRHKLLGPIALSSIYARYSGGRWPTAPVGGNAFTAGIGIDIGGS